jgi:hypothetical protein
MLVESYCQAHITTTMLVCKRDQWPRARHDLSVYLSLGGSSFLYSVTSQRLLSETAPRELITVTLQRLVRENRISCIRRHATASTPSGILRTRVKITGTSVKVHLITDQD